MTQPSIQEAVASRFRIPPEALRAVIFYITERFDTARVYGEVEAFSAITELRRMGKLAAEGITEWRSWDKLPSVPAYGQPVLGSELGPNVGGYVLLVRVERLPPDREDGEQKARVFIQR